MFGRQIIVENGVYSLESSPDLTWRDIQHLSVYSAVQVNPEDPDWELTAHGRPFSYKYGFGKLDAYAYVTMARTWQLVKPQVWIDLAQVELADARMVGKEMIGGEPIVPGGVRSSTIVTREMLEDWNFDKLEHITVKVWIKHTRRGDVEVELISPAGVRSILASRRRHDSAETGFVGWKFMTLKHWCVPFSTWRSSPTNCDHRDEDPVGQWTLRVSDQSNHETGSFLGWSMTLWGSAMDASLAEEKFELPDDPDAGHKLPSHVSPTAVTNHHPKPTSHLPSDHGAQMGEATRPAFPTNTQTTIPEAAQKGVFTNMYELLRNQLWLVGAFGIVTIFGAATGIFFCLRRRRARRANISYAPIPGGDNVPMRCVAEGGGTFAGSGFPGAGERTTGGTRELYDAFGVGSDDEDMGERAALTGGAGRFGRIAAPLTYHDGFLDDEGMSTGRTSGTPYRDAPEPSGVVVTQSTETPPREGGSEGSRQDVAADHETVPPQP
jgi:kexin